MKHGFEYKSKFNMDSSFSSVKFGYDKPVLEIELNEMQEIQNHNRKLLVNKICKSGIVEMIDKDFMGEPIVYNPNNELNKIAIAPMKVIVNGYEVHICGNYSIGQINNYILIDLGDAPDYDENYKPYRQDLVYLQIWMEELCGKEQMKRYGHDQGTVIPNTLIDTDRVGEETSHRMVLKWKIRTTNILIDFDKWEYGFGFNNSNDGNYVRIETDVTKGINIKNKEYDKIFANASHYMFKGCTFYGDNNLWLAGRPHENDASNTKDCEYVYALPLFRVDRRNKEKYDIYNPHGSKPFDEQNINLRPDNKCYDLIYPTDILDLRKTLIIGGSNINYHADKTLNDLFTGELNTKSNEKMRRIQFGVNSPSVDAENLIFLDSFNKGDNGLPVPLKPLNNQPILNSTMSSFKPYYEPNVTDWGIKIDNNFQLEYSMLKSEDTKINKYEGCIEFFLTPEWNGFDDVEQRILGLYFQAVGSEEPKPFITIDKTHVLQNDEMTNKIVINRYNDRSNNPVMSSMNISINNILKDNIYHFRIGWSKSNNAFDCYINGKKVANALDMNMIKDVDVTGIGKLILGKINENTFDNVGFIIDDLAIYNTYFDNSNWNIPQDFREGNAIILPSFNGIYRDFRGNLHEQEYLVNYLTPEINSKQFTITLPCRLKDKISFLNNPKVYCLKRTTNSPDELKDGEEILGTWSSIDNTLHQATFKLSQTGKPISTFNGEKIAIVYGLKIAGHNNVNDIPNEILKSEITSNNNTEEVAFNLENNKTISIAREVKKLVTKIKDEHGNVIGYEPVRNIYNVHDTAYDLSSFRDDNNRHLSFCRMLDYYVEGNNTRQYNVDINIYGHRALYIKSATLMTTNTYGDELIEELKITDVSIKDSKFDIKIDKVVMSGSKIKFEIALSSVGFDYNINSKTYVGNVYKAKFLEITATGATEEYTIPLDDINNGMCSSGVLIGTGCGYGYVDKIEDSINENHEHICYVDNVVQKYEFLDGYNKPFIKIKINKGGLNSNEFIESGKIIKIPILVTYQPKSSEILSVWYNYTPYQGVLSNTPMELKRLSDWKYFITTLSSGAESEYNIKNSITNTVNRLPGGLLASSRITGQDIILKNHNMLDYENINNYKLNKKLIFVNQTYNATKNNNYDESFFKLSTNYNIKKKFGSMQDDSIFLNDSPFKLYLPVNEDDCSINRYCGMYCIVSNEYGDLYLLLIGSTNNNVSTNNNFIYPEYGDLFVIQSRPSISNND